MQASNPLNVTHDGQAAQLRILRNDAQAWGHLTLRDGTRLDVEPSSDIYELDDAQALDLLARELSGASPAVEASQSSWTFGWDDQADAGPAPAGPRQRCGA